MRPRSKPKLCLMPGSFPPSDIYSMTTSKAMRRTYPTRYPIHWGYLATFQTTTTLSENGTSRVVCTETQIAYTEAFADGNSDSITADDYLGAFTASNFRGCLANHPVTALSPSTKVRVSDVTVTSTRHISHSKLPMIGTPAATTETVTPTAFSNTAVAVISEPTTTFPIYFSGPVVHSSLTGGLGPEPTPTEQTSKPTGDTAVSEQHQPVTQSLKTDQIESASPSQRIITPPVRVTVGSQTFTADSPSRFVIGTQTLEAGGPAITHDGHTLSLGSSASNIIIDSSTVSVGRLPVIAFTLEDAPVLIGSQTLTPGGPAITVSGTRVSLEPSASNVVIGTSTEPLGSIIMGGFGPTNSGEASSTITQPAAFTGGVGLGKRPCIWAAVAIIGTVVGWI